MRSWLQYEHDETYVSKRREMRYPSAKNENVRKRKGQGLKQSGNVLHVEILVVPVSDEHWINNLDVLTFSLLTGGCSEGTVHMKSPCVQMLTCLFVKFENLKHWQWLSTAKKTQYDAPPSLSIISSVHMFR